MSTTAIKNRQNTELEEKPFITNFEIKVPQKPSSKTSELKIKRTELLLLTTQLSVMIDSGVILSEALDAIAEQADESTFKLVVSDISEMVKSGESFSRTLAEYPKIFNPMFTSMVKASEASGRMSEMLRVISGYLDFEYETHKQIKSALTYPFIMMLVAFASTGSLMFFVLPKFTKIYEGRNVALPKLTQFLVNFSHLFSDFRFLTLLVTTTVLLIMALFAAAKTVPGRKVFDYMKIHLPVFGTMFIDMIVTRSMRIMATMLNTGVTLLDSVEVIKGSCNNFYFQRLWEWVDDKIRNGYQLSEAMHLSPYKNLIAPSIISMIRAGEKSGYLGVVSDKVSVFYEKKLANSIKTATKYIEPLMILILGGIIGTIAIALLLPVFRISSVIAH